MGIPGAWKVLRGIPQVFGSVKSQSADHVLIDLNPLLHRLAPYEPLAPHQPILRHVSDSLLRSLKPVGFPPRSM